MEWEELFTKHTSDNGLILKMYKNSCNSIAKEKEKKYSAKKNRKNDLKRLSLKKTYNWPTGI